MDYGLKESIHILLSTTFVIIWLALQSWSDNDDSINKTRIFKRHKRDALQMMQTLNVRKEEDNILELLTSIVLIQTNILAKSYLTLSECNGRFHGEWYIKPRSLHWWNHYIFEVRCDDERFQSIFRLPYSLFESLSEMLYEDLCQGSIPQSLATSIKSRVLPVEKQIAIALLRLSSGMTMLNVGELFGCGKSTIIRVLKKFIMAMVLRASNLIQWPVDHASMQQVKESFYRQRGFPNCCGAIDVTHVQLELPHNESSLDWYDRDYNYSMVLQAIVDSEMHFMDVFTGWPGSVNDARLLRNSSFYRLCEEGQRLNSESVHIGQFDMREYIIDDGGYPLLPWLITPFSGQLTESQQQFNFKLSSTRIVVERAFGRLKQCWRILYLKISKPNLHMLPQTILVCCILHNMLLSFTKDSDEIYDVHEINGFEENLQRNESVGSDPHATISQTALMEYINRIDDNVDD